MGDYRARILEDTLSMLASHGPVEFINGWSDVMAEYLRGAGFSIVQRVGENVQPNPSADGYSIVLGDAGNIVCCETVFLVYSSVPVDFGEVPVIVDLRPSAIHTLPQIYKHLSNVVRFRYDLFDAPTILKLYRAALELFLTVPDLSEYVCGGANGLLVRHTTPFSLVFDESTGALYFGDGPFARPFALAAIEDDHLVPKNVEFLSIVSQIGDVPRPFCSTCAIRDVCPLPSLDDAYRMSGDPLLPSPQICAVHHAIVRALADAVERRNAWESMRKCTCIKNTLFRIYLQGGLRND